MAAYPKNTRRKTPKKKPDKIQDLRQKKLENLSYTQTPTPQEKLHPPTPMTPPAKTKYIKKRHR